MHYNPAVAYCQFQLMNIKAKHQTYFYLLRVPSYTEVFKQRSTQTVSRIDYLSTLNWDNQTQLHGLHGISIHYTTIYADHTSRSLAFLFCFFSWQFLLFFRQSRQFSSFSLHHITPEIQRLTYNFTGSLRLFIYQNNFTRLQNLFTEKQSSLHTGITTLHISIRMVSA